MILATHAIVGAAAGRIFSNPYAAFIAGFASHFVMDAIPHKDYTLNSFEPGEDKSEDDMVLDRRFIGDSVKAGVDLLTGAAIIIFIFRDANGLINNPVSLLAGAIGGILPDFLEVVSFKIRREPLVSLRKFHLVVHSKIKPSLFWGAASQITVIAIIAAVFKLIY